MDPSPESLHRAAGYQGPMKLEVGQASHPEGSSNTPSHFMLGIL